MTILPRTLLIYTALLLILSSVMGSTRVLAAAPELEWCLDHFPPRHSYLPGQQPKGPMVDMMQKLATQSGFTLKFTPPTPVARCLKLMQQGKTDLWPEKSFLLPLKNS